MEKGQSFQHMLLGKLDIQMQTKVNPYLSPHTKLKMDQISKLLEENLRDTGFGNAFLDMTPKEQATERKTRLHQN